MRWTWITLFVAGLGVLALGTLWFLQGSDLLHVEPVLCAGECETVSGHQPTWQLAGAAAFLAGGLASTVAVRRLRRAR